MTSDGKVPKKECSTVYLKDAPDNVGMHFYHMSSDREINSDVYLIKY